MPGGRPGCGLPPGRPQEHDALRPDRCPAVSMAAAGCIPPFPGVPGRVKDRKKKQKPSALLAQPSEGCLGPGCFLGIFVPVTPFRPLFPLAALRQEGRSSVASVACYIQVPGHLAELKLKKDKLVSGLFRAPQQIAKNLQNSSSKEDIFDAGYLPLGTLCVSLSPKPPFSFLFFQGI